MPIDPADSKGYFTLATNIAEINQELFQQECECKIFLLMEKISKNPVLPISVLVYLLLFLLSSCLTVRSTAPLFFGKWHGTQILFGGKNEHKMDAK